MKTLRSNTVRLLTALLAFGLFQSRNIATLHAQTDYIWDGGAGTWSDSALWSTGTVPNDPTADVFIDGGKTSVSSVVTLDNSYTIGALTIDAGDTLNFNDSSALTVSSGTFAGDGSIVDNGTININANNYDTDLNFSGTLGISGSGTLNLNGGNARVYASTAGNRMTIGAGFTVAGVGQLGLGQTTFTNNGTVNANSSGNTLSLQPGGGTADFTNGTGAVAEASNGGNLELNGNSGGSFSGGTFQALTGSNINLDNGASISSAILTTAGTGTVTVTNTANLTNVTNYGTINENDGATTTLAGTFTNNGTFNNNANNYTTDIRLNGAVNLAGTGTFNLSSGNARFYAINPGDLLTIGAGITISGVGQIGIGLTTFTNNGLVDANSNGGTLTINPGGGTSPAFTNAGAGLAEASKGGLLELSGSNSGSFVNGTFEALNGSTVILDNGANVSGATLNTMGSGSVTVTNSATLTNVTNSGTINLNDSSTTTLVGTLTNNASLNNNANNYQTDIRLNGPVTLAGTGTVNLAAGNARLYAINPGDRLTINAGATIDGAGQLGVNQTTFTNNGTVNANINGGTLTVQPGSGSADFTNAGSGFAEATNGGILELSGSNAGSFASGTFEALTGSTVILDNGANISGAILTTVGTGNIVVTNAATLTNVTNTGTINLNDSSNTVLVGKLTNNGTLNNNANNYTTNIQLSGPVTLAGTGTVNLATGNARLYANNPGDRLTINAGATIDGAGQLGVGQTTFTNNGTVNANINGGTLTINPGSSTADFTNAGLGFAEATNGGFLELSGGSGGTFASGTFEALTGSTVILDNGANVSSATLTTAGSGSVTVTNSATLTNVTNNGTINLNDNSTTTLAGTLTNNGSLNNNGNNYTTDIRLSGPVTLAGTGTVNLASGNARLYANNPGDRLTINAGATIQGAGQLGVGQTTFTNNGTVNASINGGTLTINPGSSTADFTNAGSGFAEATNGGFLELSGGSGGTFASGTFEALTGSTVILDNGANVSSATLTTAGSGSVTVTNSATLTNVTNNGTINLNDNSTTTLVGTLTNNGTLNNNGNNYTTDIRLSGPVTLAGTGTVNLATGNARLYANNPGDRLTINAGATINGAGQLGVGQTTFTNNGTVNASINGGTLTVQPGSGSGTPDFTNGTTGLAEATGGGVAVLTNVSGGTFTNNGTFAVISGSTGGGSSFSVSPGALTNFSGTTLTGGTYNVISTNPANTSTLSFGGGSIVTNAASVTLSGASTVFNEIGTLAANQGTFAVANGRNFTTVGALSNSGTVIAAGGSTLTVIGAFTQVSSGVLTGGGTFGAADFTIAGTVNPGGTVSTLTGLFADAAGTTTLDGNAAFTNTTFNYQLGSPTGTNDHLDTDGTLSLSGKLNVAALSGFGTGTYDLIDYSVVDNPLFVADHGTLTLGTLPTGYTYLLNYAIPGQVDLTVVQLAVPEPGTPAFILGGVALLIGLQRLRRQGRSARA